MLQSMGSQRAGHDWVTELNCTEHTQRNSQQCNREGPNAGWLCQRGNTQVFVRGRNTLQGHGQEWLPETNGMETSIQSREAGPASWQYRFWAPAPTEGNSFHDKPTAISQLSLVDVPLLHPSVQPAPPPQICSSLFSAQPEAAPHPGPPWLPAGGQQEEQVFFPRMACANGPPQWLQLSPRWSIIFPDSVYLAILHCDHQEWAHFPPAPWLTHFPSPPCPPNQPRSFHILHYWQASSGKLHTIAPSPGELGEGRKHSSHLLPHPKIQPFIFKSPLPEGGDMGGNN